MTLEDEIRERINALFESNPNIHISMTYAKPLLHIVDECAKITGVYKHMFMVEVGVSGRSVRHSIRYGELLCGCVKISELE